ncbi:hypothetical protein F4802DRAFT_368248 [Xylaria palmicola]|nr:hypothetical protein F4802DRAFT_368248 [Xylaria palmicola]
MADTAAESSTRTSRPVEGSGRSGSADSPPAAEKGANVLSGAANTATATVAAPTKQRSCVVCRSRKVRCDKESPCSNCRRAGIPCVVPSADRPPRWARRLERVAHAAQAVDQPAAEVMERLRNLERLVRDLTSQLEQAQAAANTSSGNSPASSADNQRATPPAMGAASIQPQFGRLVLSDASRSRYVSSGFWSRVNDELDEIKMETRHLTEADFESSDDEELSGASPSTLELERTAAERHAFLFRHNLGGAGPDLRELHPLPSQIPFLLDVFSENVNAAVQIVHMPTVNKIARRSRGSDITRLTPAHEALMFSIYYAAITSMEEDDVVNNFGSTKNELNLRYRLGLEHALARADFLSVPDIVLVQAFTIFLLLVRRHDSPRFVWMMTGLGIRMAQALGLQRDGTHFQHLTPFEIDARRRVWYALCALDVRASEDQGTEFTIPYGSFDTQLPWNINNDDIDVDTKSIPPEREGITDMTLAIVSMEMSHISRQLMSPGISLEEQNQLAGTIYANLEARYLRFSTESGNINYWVIVVCTRLVDAKLTLFTHLPILFSSPSELFSDEIRNKLLVAAIEVAEFNHALNAENACRQWRWIYQTYTHWHAVVYLLLDICRRPWSPLVDRAWIALHSPWLIPARSKLDKESRTWVPLRRLMLKARKHRETQIERLRGDASVARQLEVDDCKLPVPSTVGSISASAVANTFRDRWRRLVGLSEIPEEHTQIDKQAPPAAFELISSGQVQLDSTILGPSTATKTGLDSHPTYSQANTFAMYELSQEPSAPSVALNTVIFSQPLSNGPHHNLFSETAVNRSDIHAKDDGLLNWFWADADHTLDVFSDVNMDMTDFNFDLDGEIDWHNWLQSTKGI